MEKEMKKKRLWQLFIAFFHIGVFTIGGGYAMLPMLRKVIVEKYQWAKEEDLLDYFAIGQTTPGIIAVNTATFVGVKQGGWLGGVIATAGIVTPSLIIISLIAALLQQFEENVYMTKAFAGIQVVVVGMIITSVIQMFKKTVKSRKDNLLFFVGFIAVAWFQLSSITVIGGVFLLALIRSLFIGKEGEKS